MGSMVRLPVWRAGSQESEHLQESVGQIRLLFSWHACAAFGACSMSSETHTQWSLPSEVVAEGGLAHSRVESDSAWRQRASVSAGKQLAWSTHASQLEQEPDRHCDELRRG